jgi:hypothetical protein
MKYITHFFAILLAFVLIGCDSAGEGKHNLGEQVYYKDFWFSKFVPDTLSKTLNVDFTEASSPIKLQLYKKIEGGKEVAVKTTEAQLFLNSKKCLSNVITLKPSKHKAQLGLVFSSQAPEGDYTWYVKVIDWGGLEQINSGTNDTLFVWHAAKIVKMNPVQLNLIFSSIGLVLLLLICVLISRCMHPTAKFTKVFITYSKEQEREIKMAGRYELVCTSNFSLKDSFIKRLFYGKRQFEYSTFWTHDIVVKSGSGDKVRILNLKDFGLSGDTIRKEKFIITNNQNESVSIETN